MNREYLKDYPFQLNYLTKKIIDYNLRCTNGIHILDCVIKKLLTLRNVWLWLMPCDLPATKVDQSLRGLAFCLFV